MTQNRELIKNLIGSIEFTGDLQLDVSSFLTHYGFADTATHCLLVAKVAKEVAHKYNEDEDVGFQAGMLHDVSAVFPPKERVIVAKSLDIDILPEEEIFPLIVHQKLSAVLAKEIFNITNHAVISAVGCHTTLKANASNADKVLFVADKIQWDQNGTPPYLENMLRDLESSLDEGAYCYLSYMWEKRSQLRVIHPWLRDAYMELGKKLGKN